MNKVEVLEQVAKRIEKQGTLQFRYVNNNNDCFCAVGHVMAVCGVDLTLIAEAEEDLNHERITDFKMERLIAPVIEAGFTVKELNELQKLNDSEDDSIQRNILLIDELEKMKSWGGK